MKLLSLRLKNFRQHSDTLLEFKDGITGIIGSNGAGKSTVIEGVIFALYGVKKIRGRSDELKTYGSNPNETTFAELCFLHDGQVYLIYRDLSTARLQAGSQLLAEGQKVVSDRIMSLLKMNFEEFAAAYCTEQKSLEFLSVRQGAAERERFIAEMLGYDKIERVQDLLRADRRNLKNEIAGLEAGIGNRQPLEDKIEIEKKALLKLKSEEAEYVKVQELAEKEELQAKKTLEALQQNFQSYQELKGKLQIANLKRDEAVQRLDSLTKRQTLSDLKISEVLNKYKVVQAETAIELTKDLKNKILVLQDRKEALEQELAVLLTQQNNKIGAAQAEEHLLKAKVRDAETRLKDLAKLKESASCPTCGQQLGDEFKNIKKYLQNDIKTFNVKLAAQSQELSELQQGSPVINNLKQQIGALFKEVQIFTVQHDELQELSQEFYESVRLLTELKDLQLNLSQLLSQIELYAGRLKELKFSEEDYSRATNDFTTKEKLLNIARLQRVKHDGLLRESESLLKRSQEELERFDTNAVTLARKRKEFLALSDADNVMIEFRSALNAAIRPRLAEIASEYLADLSDGRYSAVLISEDFSPAVYENGFVKNVLSGGEEDLLNVCLRLSLSTLIAERSGHSFSLLLMDEIFGSLDEGRRQNVIALLERLQNRFEQIILITHLDDIKDSVRHLLYINYDEASASLTIGNAATEEQIAVNI